MGYQSAAGRQGSFASFGRFPENTVQADNRAYQALVWSRISEIVILGDVYFPLPFQGGINA